MWAGGVVVGEGDSRFGTSPVSTPSFSPTSASLFGALPPPPPPPRCVISLETCDAREEISLYSCHLLLKVARGAREFNHSLSDFYLFIYCFGRGFVSILPRGSDRSTPAAWQTPLVKKKTPFCDRDRSFEGQEKEGREVISACPRRNDTWRNPCASREVNSDWFSPSIKRRELRCFVLEGASRMVFL